MGAYEITCIVVAVLVVIFTTVNIIVWLLRKRKKTNVANEVAVPSSEPVAQPVQEPVVTELVEDDVQEEIDETPIEDSSDDDGVADEIPVEDTTDIILAFDSGNVEETDSGATVYNADGTVFYFRYNKSFKAKLIQAKDEVREYYNQLKNYVLSYKKVKTSISWGQESVRYGKEKVCWLVLRGKSLYLYLPLNPDDYADTKYKVEWAKAKRFEELPCMYKITNNRRVKYAFELIETVMQQYETEFVEREAADYAAEYPYEPTIELIKNKLIKVTKTNRTFPTK